MAITFKTPRQAQDFGSLTNTNKRLYQFANLLSSFISLEFNKDVVVTDVFRTKEEFDALYAQTPVERRPTDSPHCYWNAFDLRSTLYTEAELTRIQAFADSFRYKNGVKKVMLLHSIDGNSRHMHFQYV